MKNFVDTGEDFKIRLQSGETAYKSGDGYVLGDTVGVLAVIKRPAANSGDIDGRTVMVNEASAAGDIAILKLRGVYEFPKASGAIAAGAIVYYDPAAKNITATAGSLKQAGWAEFNLLQTNGGWLTGDTTIRVKLRG